MPSTPRTGRLATLDAREMRPDELPAVSRLFEQAGWGTLPADLLGRWFAGGALGPWLVMVLVDPDGEIVGGRSQPGTSGGTSSGSSRVVTVTDPELAISGKELKDRPEPDGSGREWQYSG